MHTVICLFSPCKIASSLSGIGYRRSFYNRPDFPLPEIYCRQFYANFAAKAQHGYPLGHKTSQPRNLQAVAMKIYSKTDQLATVVPVLRSISPRSNQPRQGRRAGRLYDTPFIAIPNYHSGNIQRSKPASSANHDESITLRYWIIYVRRPLVVCSIILLLLVCLLIIYRIYFLYVLIIRNIGLVVSGFRVGLIIFYIRHDYRCLLCLCSIDNRFIAFTIVFN